MKKKSIICLFRNSSYFSIEQLFSILQTYWNKSVKSVEFIVLPKQGAGVKALLENLWFAFKLRKSEVIHITGDVNYTALILPHKKLILTIHDIEMLNREKNRWRYYIFYYLWFQLPILKARIVTCISEESKRALLSNFRCNEKKIVVIHNPYDPEYTYTPKPFNEKLPTILFLGSKHNKNLSRVILALKGLNCHLRIIAKLSPQYIKELEESSINYSNVSGLSKSEVISEYQKCDMLCFVSTIEGFGLPILEAQAIGRVVLTSNISSMPEVAGANGALLVDPYSVEDIRDGILKICSDNILREKFISEGQNNIKRFNPEKIAEQYLNLYDFVQKNTKEDYKS